MGIGDFFSGLFDSGSVGPLTDGGDYASALSGAGALDKIGDSLGTVEGITGIMSTVGGYLQGRETLKSNEEALKRQEETARNNALLGLAESKYKMGLDLLKAKAGAGGAKPVPGGNFTVLNMIEALGAARNAEMGAINNMGSNVSSAYRRY